MRIVYVEYDAEETPAPVELCWRRKDPRLKVAGAVFSEANKAVVVFTHLGTDHKKALVEALYQNGLSLSDASEYGGGGLLVVDDELVIGHVSITLGGYLPAELREPAIAYAKEKMGR